MLPSRGKKGSKELLINISTSTILKLVLIVAVLWFIYFIKGILAILFIALILTSLVDPFATWIGKKRIPRGLAVIIVYLILLGILIGFSVIIIPPMLGQTKALIRDFPAHWHNLTQWFSSLVNYELQSGFLDSVKQWENKLPLTLGGAFSKLSSVFGGIISFFVVLVITYYMVVEDDAMKRIFRTTTPRKYQPYLLRIINKIQVKIGLWLRGQLILALIVGSLTYIGLMILGVEYALVLALIAGVLEIVPYLGPIIATIPAVFLGLSHSPLLALLVLILYFVIQQAENHILVPKIMQKAIGLNPVFCIISLLVGAKIVGLVGVILAIPVATAISVIIEDRYENSLK